MPKYGTIQEAVKIGLTHGLALSVCDVCTNMHALLMLVPPVPLYHVGVHCLSPHWRSHHQLMPDYRIAFVPVHHF